MECGMNKMYTYIIVIYTILFSSHLFVYSIYLIGACSASSSSSSLTVLSITSPFPFFSNSRARKRQVHQPRNITHTHIPRTRKHIAQNRFTRIRVNALTKVHTCRISFLVLFNQLFFHILFYHIS